MLETARTWLQCRRNTPTPPQSPTVQGGNATVEFRAASSCSMTWVSASEKTENALRAGTQNGRGVKRPTGRQGVPRPGKAPSFTTFHLMVILPGLSTKLTAVAFK